MINAGTQFIRKVSLLVSLGNTMLDLSQMKFTFKVYQSDVETPNNAVIRIYNLSDATIAKITGPAPGGSTSTPGPEFKQVTLSGGYVNAQFGLIFLGTIKQTKRGRENAVDTYFELLCSDSDLAINFGFVNTTLETGNSSAAAQAQAVSDANTQVQPNATLGDTSGLAGGTLPRGKVFFAMGRDVSRDLAKSNQCFWSMQNGKLQYTKRTAYLPGTAVVLNAKSGLIGQPEQTEEGILITCLLNPNIVIGSVVQINNKAINTTSNAPGGVPFNQVSGIQLLASIAADGNYRAFVVEHNGDTRGNPWYTTITALSIDTSAPDNSAVAGGGNF